MIGVRKINLGCGNSLFGGGWINVDIRTPSFVGFNLNFVCADLKIGVPFSSESVDVVYSSHFLEHLDPFEECHFFLDECFRVLRRNGVIRLVVPDFRRIAEIYLRSPRSFYEEYGYSKPWFGKAETWNRRMGISVMHGHKMIYDIDSISEVLAKSSFRNVAQVDGLREGLLPGCVASEIIATHVSHSLVVDAIK